MTTSPPEREIEILLVEDNPADVRLAQEALKSSRIRNRLHVAVNGVEALAFLYRQPGYEDAPRPDLIILDLNLPLKDGSQVLSEIKFDEELKQIPVVVLTTSKAQSDIAKVYNLHANCFITKPLDLEKFFTVMDSIQEFWFSTATLPPNQRNR